MGIESKKPITDDELHRAACEVHKEEALGVDGMVNNFFTLFRDVLGADYDEMVRAEIHNGGFLNRVSKVLITLIPKVGDQINLSNWHLVTLLNVAYLIYAKALQLRLQGIILTIISVTQSVLLEKHFILDNILLTHVTLSWNKNTKENTIFLELDFSKAYDQVNWNSSYPDND